MAHYEEDKESARRESNRGLGANSFGEQSNGQQQVGVRRPPASEHERDRCSKRGTL